jgi:predicted transglutaminase-like cysteine proteinase
MKFSCCVFVCALVVCFAVPQTMAAVCRQPAVTMEEKIGCVMTQLEGLTQRQLPDNLVPVVDDSWPGQATCVSCNFYRGTIWAVLEVAVLFALLRWASNSIVAAKRNSNDDFCSSNKIAESESSNWLKNMLKYSLGAVSAFGWLYWSILAGFWYNFICYIVLVGPIVVAPHLVAALRSEKLQNKSAVLSRWLLAVGVVFCVLTVAVFPNVALMPSQVVRHLRMPETLITPDSLLVQQLKGEFLAEFPTPVFDSMSFAEQMYAVDKFIFREIKWTSDMSQFGMTGLLVTPDETIERRAGDCQCQAVTTASLLQALGFEAFVTESPLHWWSSARSPSGQLYQLNSHGNGAGDGSVLPQPPDLIFTNWPAQCHDCPSFLAHNKNNVIYQADPLRAFAVSVTGMHIFVREFLPTVTQLKLVMFAALFAALFALAAAIFWDDLGVLHRKPHRLLARAALGFALSYVNMQLVVFWATWQYPTTMISMVALLTLTYSAVASIQFNVNILQTPNPF